MPVVAADPAPVGTPPPTTSGTRAVMTEAPQLGDLIGRYVLRRVIGAGGMGTVYEAEHVVLEKRVALKVLQPEIAVHEDLRKRFVREGLAASRVRHPHVVDVTDAAEENGRAYLVMELLEGRGLDEELAAHGRFDIGRSSEIILPICAALAEAHAVGVVHRDMKPENVLLVRSFGDRIVPKVVDFGISDLIGGTWNDGSSPVLGTPHYMAPEQANGEVVDGLADQYAVGVMLFELLTGRLPYDPSKLDDPIALLGEVIGGRVHRLSDVWPDVPERLDAVLARATHPDPRRRFRTMERFGRALLPLASPRAIRRYRDLVDPGWSAIMPAVGALVPCPPPPIPPAPPQPPGIETEVAPRRPVDTISSPPPDMDADASGPRPRITSNAPTLRWSSAPPPPSEAPVPAPIAPPPPPRARRFCEPHGLLEVPTLALPRQAQRRSRASVRTAAAIAGALIALATVLGAAVATHALGAPAARESSAPETGP